ncbi:2-keto-4-pentenoate hydratase/2-oxohepta-3-ene-1,7-dioic acid hydratase in catechol pathway/regulator of RNase E activity RraA [Agromyces hippuratus]|uniref:2-keto-4-pentenoate hydratase/2-oxohepta-3-ene-1,7-dioic acid hydratase in catechol pathway/regulator of RNase E activity RraA n=1 Tax=Agromyces hippuratus TaxID=286438 RepID=A0A852WR13_9MICO|nr:fumarylacetoacetate hydrolase family protein [Agromyces hippuratus]NYG20622.1 2-keto-4-pentenoate hydratase/2-oxohepta-3-ene-1,7-dioic acid hydratase in catechol pathway/regulator of RNase E activity RraA [Agromyces hippuratus]
MTSGIATPGKIIAVHLNYPSRAAQRGRTPAQPSYFLKPASSLAPTGATLERPAGTELLAFEGEIAIVIGEPARRVSPADGWKHVASVTAANDFGLYDLRAADKGSNVRSKGGDGFTPLGPAAIPAAGIGEGDWRVRTWVNGRLVQEDTSDTLLFPFGRLVADLSQLMTLETGDVILTGTPAGSSVVLPGDVVEVEVDAPGTPGAPTTGRLVTTITQGAAEFGDYGTKPATDDLQRVEAWGSDDELAAAVAAGRASAPTTTSTADAAAPAAPAFELTDELRADFGRVAVATLSVALRKRGYHDIFIEGVAANHPGDRIVGRAKTLRFIPFRPDLFQSHGGGFNAQKLAFDTVAPGEVLVVEARGERGTGTVGDVLALRAQVRGAAGIVTDGGVRDFDAVAGFEIPVFSQGAHPSVLGRRHVPWEVDVTIACGGAAVQPGDVIVGDGDGVIVIPPQLVEEVLAEALEQERQEAYVAEQVAAGASVDGLFPMNAEWLARYRAAEEAR